MAIMKSIKDFYFKKKQQIVPWYCLVLYPILVGLDLFTTYLVTPDLSHEGNPIFRYFHWGWRGLLTWNFLIVVITLFLVVLSGKITIKYINTQKRIKSTDKILLYISYLLFFCFYTHFVGEIYAVSSNYLFYFGLQSKLDNVLYNIAVDYGHFVFQKGATIYLATLYLITSLLGILITAYRVYHVKKRVIEKQ
jgi:hypothetical protein